MINMGLDIHIYGKKEKDGEIILDELLYFGKYYQIYNYFIKKVCCNIELDNVLFPFEVWFIDELLELCSEILEDKEQFMKLPYHKNFNSYNTMGNVDYDEYYYRQLEIIIEVIKNSNYKDYDEFYFMWN